MRQLLAVFVDALEERLDVWRQRVVRFEDHPLREDRLAVPVVLDVDAMALDEMQAQLGAKSLVACTGADQIVEFRLQERNQPVKRLAVSRMRRRCQEEHVPTCIRSKIFHQLIAVLESPAAMRTGMRFVDNDKLGS